MVQRTKNKQEAMNRARNPVALSLCILCSCLSIGITFPLFSRELHTLFIATNTVVNYPGMRESEPPDTLTHPADSFGNGERFGGQGQTEEFNRLDSLREKHPVVQKREPNEIKVKLAENRLTIENLEQDGVLEVYNIMGAKVYTQRVKAGTSTHILSLPKGYYIIRIGKYSRKIAVR